MVSSTAFCYALLVCFVGFSSPGGSFVTGTPSVPKANQMENVAMYKTVIGDGSSKNLLVDGKEGTTYVPPGKEFSYYYVDLRAIYNLTSIHLVADKPSNGQPRGKDVKFSVYTWDRHTSLCAFRDYYPWHLVKDNLSFTTSGQELELQPQKAAQYIIIVTHTVKLGSPTAGVPMAELRAYGEKIKESPVPKEPEGQSVRSNHHRRTRLAIIGKQEKLRIEQNFGQWILNNTLRDVAIGWHHDRINTMAAHRGKGHVVAILGTQIINLLNTTEYTELKQNLQRWLGAHHKNASFVTVSGPTKRGDILIITQRDNFDVDQVYRNIYCGNNPAFIAYLSQINRTNDNATLLLEKLGINLLRHDGRYMPRDIPLQDKINSVDYVPTEALIRQALHSWKLFRTERLPQSFPKNEIKTETVQKLIRQIAKKYGPFMAEIAPCEAKYYNSNPNYNTALQNYNDLLLLQLGEDVVKLPGIAFKPGDVDPTVQPSNYTVTLNIGVAGSYFPVGGYAKPGVPFRWRVINTTANSYDEFYIRVNAQVDSIHGHGQWVRWPRVASSIALTPEGAWATAHGGPIFLSIPANTNITIRFENVYRHAWFDIRDKQTIKNWEQELRAKAGVPWTVIMGDQMYSQLPTYGLHNTRTQDFVYAVNFYDNAIKMIHNYRGTKFEEWRTEVMSIDIQILVGAAHAGYPWQGTMSFLSGYVATNELVHGRMIGYVHEIGHNLQVLAATLKSGTEVTNNVNIFTTYDHLLKLPMYDIGHRPGLTTEDQKSMLKIWRGEEYVGPQLIYYAHLGRMFGEGLVGNLFTKAMALSSELNNEEKRTQYWLREICNETGYNMLPFHRLWNFPIDNATEAAVAHLPCFLPDDIWTKQVPEKVSKILSQYGGNCTRESNKVIPFRGDLKRGLNVRGPKFIFFHD